MEAENIAYADRNPYIGPPAVAEGIFGRIMTEWNDFRVATEGFISEGEKVVVLGRYSATFKATGRPLDAQFVHVWTVRDGKIVAFQQYADTAQFERVMRTETPR
ncbi:MAG: nuclear transport factor 2 family protein [Thermoanaerobaculia bacterium]